MDRLLRPQCHLLLINLGVRRVINAPVYHEAALLLHKRRIARNRRQDTLDSADTVEIHPGDLVVDGVLGDLFMERNDALVFLCLRVELEPELVGDCVL